MCNTYKPPADARAIEQAWEISNGRGNGRWWDDVLYPRGNGPFVRRAKGDPGFSRELVVGQWGLIPWFAKAPQPKYPTHNARSEELAQKASYKDPWARGQRCIIPAETFDEPNWETGRNVWWRFRRADGELWGLAGLWNTWTDPASGEVRESYTMLTLNADADPLMRRMHKPHPERAAAHQDKRSVIALSPEDYDQWLCGTLRDAQSLLRLAPTGVYDAGPAEDKKPAVPTNAPLLF